MNIVKESIMNYDEWLYEVAQHIAKIVTSNFDPDSDDNRELEIYYNFFMDPDIEMDPFKKYDRQLFKMHVDEVDTETAAYKILYIIKNEMNY